MKTQIAIAAPSLIRTKDEGDIVIQTINNLSTLSIPIIITDGGSPKEYKKIIQNIPGVIFLEANNLTNELVYAFNKAASVAENIFYLQTDKIDFSKTIAPSLIKEYLKLNSKSILIPNRTQESFSTYPAFQHTVENFLNFFIGDYIGINNDYYLGPKIFPSELVKYLSQLKGEIGWGVEAFLYVVAKRLNYNFKFYEAFVKSPKDIEGQVSIKLNRLHSVSRQLDGFYQGLEVKLT